MQQLLLDTHTHTLANSCDIRSVEVTMVISECVKSHLVASNTSRYDWYAHTQTHTRGVIATVA